MDAAWRGVQGSSTKQPRLYDCREAFMSHTPQPRPSRASTLSIKTNAAKSSVLAEKAYQHEKARKEQAKRAHGCQVSEAFNRTTKTLSRSEAFNRSTKTF